MPTFRPPPRTSCPAIVMSAASRASCGRRRCPARLRSATFTVISSSQARGLTLAALEQLSPPYRLLRDLAGDAAENHLSSNALELTEQIDQLGVGGRELQ